MPLIATTPAIASSGGCQLLPTTLTIEKTDPSGRPLSGAEFEVTGELYDRSMFGTMFGSNPGKQAFDAATKAYQSASDAASIARSTSERAAQALADAIEAHEAAIAALESAQETGSGGLEPDSPEALELKAAVDAAASDLAAAEQARDQAFDYLEAAELAGDAVEIAAAQAAFDAAEDAAAQAEADYIAAVDSYNSAVYPGAPADELDELQTAVNAAAAAVQDAQVDADAAAGTYRVRLAAREKASADLNAAWISVHEQADGTATVTTGDDGTATLELIGSASCMPDDVYTAVLEDPIVREVKAPDGFELSDQVYEPVRQDDGSWHLTVVNEPVIPVPEEPAEPDPESESTQESTEPTSEPLASTGSDLAAPITFAAILVGAAVISSGPLLARLRRR